MFYTINSNSLDIGGIQGTIEEFNMEEENNKTISKALEVFVVELLAQRFMRLRDQNFFRNAKMKGKKILNFCGVKTGFETSICKELLRELEKNGFIKEIGKDFYEENLSKRIYKIM